MEQRDPQLSQAYREAEHPAPPPALDARILAEARKAVAPPRRRAVWFGWAIPLSTAAVLVLGISLLFRMQQDAPDTLREALPPPSAENQSGPAAGRSEPPGLQAGAPAAKAPPQVRSSARSAPPPTAAQPVAADTVAAAPERGVASEAPASAPPPLAPQSVQDNAFPAETAKAMPAAPAASPARLERAPAAPAMQGLRQHKAQTRLDVRPEADVEAGVESIRQMLRQGRSEDARKALADLRERYPAYPLPEDLKLFAQRASLPPPLEKGD